HPVLFLYDVTRTYLEGEHNALGEFGYNRDGKKGKLQIVIGLLTDPSGEPLAVRAFRGNTADPKTVATQIEILTKQFAVQDVVFVGDRGMVKSTGKQNLKGAGFRYISALTDPQIRKLLSEKILQMELFTQQVCEVEADTRAYLLLHARIKTSPGTGASPGNRIWNHRRGSTCGHGCRCLGSTEPAVSARLRGRCDPQKRNRPGRSTGEKRYNHCHAAAKT